MSKKRPTLDTYRHTDQYKKSTLQRNFLMWSSGLPRGLAAIASNELLWKFTLKNRLGIDIESFESSKNWFALETVSYYYLLTHMGYDKLSKFFQDQLLARERASDKRERTMTESEKAEQCDKARELAAVLEARTGIQWPKGTDITEIAPTPVYPQIDPRGLYTDSMIESVPSHRTMDELDAPRVDKDDQPKYDTNTGEPLTYENEEPFANLEFTETEPPEHYDMRCEMFKTENYTFFEIHKNGNPIEPYKEPVNRKETRYGDEYVGGLGNPYIIMTLKGEEFTPSQLDSAVKSGIIILPKEEDEEPTDDQSE